MNTTNNKDLIILTEDYALSIQVDLLSIIEEKQREGFRIDKKFNHPAVGQVVHMIRDYHLAS